MRRSPRGWWNSSPPASLQRPVAALSHRQRMVRRLPPRDRVRHRGSDRQHLLRPVVPDRHRMHESRRRLLLPAGDEGRRHHKILSGGRGGQIPCPPRTRSLLTWTRAGSQNPKPRRTYAAGASSCRVSQGGWEGRDTGRYLGKEFRETRTASLQKVGRTVPIDAALGCCEAGYFGTKFRLTLSRRAVTGDGFWKGEDDDPDHS